MLKLEIIKQKIDAVHDDDKMFIANDLAASNADIEHIESDLNVKLPKSYQWFLRNYGAGGVNGVFIEGMGAPEHRYAVVEETFDFRKDHPDALPGWVFLEWICDDWVCLLDTARNNETADDCPVIAYQIGENRWEDGWSTFTDYLEERFA